MRVGNRRTLARVKPRGDGAGRAVVRVRRIKHSLAPSRVHVVARETRTEATYVVRDEGPGFDPRDLPDPTDLADLDKPSGRGLMLIRTFMDEVWHNEKGNEIHMIMRCRSPESDREPSDPGG